MVRYIPGRVMKYPVDAQSDGFVCAFVSALLAIPGEAEGDGVVRAQPPRLRKLRRLR